MRSGRTKPMVSANYIVGLTDGEGCFYVNVVNSLRYIAGARIDLNFHIKMQEKDKDLLGKVKDKLGCGNVYFQKEKRKNHVQCYRYTVNSHKDIIGRIIPFFQRYSLQSASKQKSFHLFCKIAGIVRNKKHLTKEGIKQIRKLKPQINQRTVGIA